MPGRTLLGARRAGDAAGDPDVDHLHRRTDLAGDDVDGGAAGDEVGHHLRGDVLRPPRHARDGHAVVGREHRHPGCAGIGGGHGR